MESYKINYKNHIKYLIPFILGTVFVIVIYIFVLNLKFIIFDLIVLIFYILSGVLPIMLTHFHYYIKNKDDIIKIDYENSSFYYNNRRISFSDVLAIELHQSLIKSKKGIQLLPTGDYHYSKILLKNGQILYITCLLAPDFDLGMKNISKVKPRIIAAILFENILASDIY